MRRKLVVIFSIMLSAWSVYAQVSVPLTNSDLMDIERERDIMKMMNIDVSQTWMSLVKGSIVSTNRVLVSEIYYNDFGCPEKMMFFDERKNLETFTVVKYNNNKLPFEEIRFSADSSLINGIMYIYDDTDLLEKQINYNNAADILSTYVYERTADSVLIYEYDYADELLSSSYFLMKSESFTGRIDKIVKKDYKNNTSEKQIFEYDDMSILTRKLLFENNNSAGFKTFIYSDEGALLKVSFYNDQDVLINSTSYEYDSFGNIISIIEKDEVENMSKVFSIKYLTRIE